MKNKIIFSALLTLTFLVVLTSCKPKEDEPVVPATKTCRLASFTYGNNTKNVSFEYDANEKLIKQDYLQDSVYLTFEYKGDSIIERITFYKMLPLTTQIDHRIKLNADRNIIGEIDYSNSYMTYTYDNNGYLQTGLSQSNGSNITTDTYTVINGNYTSKLTNESSSGINYTTTYDYYLNALNKGTGTDYITGGLLDIRYGKQSKNMLKSYTEVKGTSTQYVSFTYEYDSEGNVIKEVRTSTLNSNPSTTTTTLYTFKCE